jgi:hypothetical protein
MKTTTCQKCGTHNLVWRQSVKGNWYLANPRTISTNTYGNHITIPFAHKCVEKKEEAPKSEAFLSFRRNQILEKQTLHPEWMTQDDLDELESIEIQLTELKAN